jgi:hypothetical protein
MKKEGGGGIEGGTRGRKERKGQKEGYMEE